MKKVMILLCMFAVTFVTGCATIFSGTQQTVSIDTPDVKDAKCILSNGKGSWHVNTPASVNVEKAYGPLMIACKKSGYEKSEDNYDSHINVPFFFDVILLSPLGIGVDIIDNAAYNYPDKINIDMQRIKKNTIAKKTVADKNVAENKNIKNNTTIAKTVSTQAADNKNTQTAQSNVVTKTNIPAVDNKA